LALDAAGWRSVQKAVDKAFFDLDGHVKGINHLCKQFKEARGDDSAYHELQAMAIIRLYARLEEFLLSVSRTLWSAVWDAGNRDAVCAVLVGEKRAQLMRVEAGKAIPASVLATLASKATKIHQPVGGWDRLCKLYGWDLVLAAIGEAGIAFKCFFAGEDFTPVVGTLRTPQGLHTMFQFMYGLRNTLAHGDHEETKELAMSQFLSAAALADKDDGCRRDMWAELIVSSLDVTDAAVIKFYCDLVERISTHGLDVEFTHYLAWVMQSFTVEVARAFTSAIQRRAARAAAPSGGAGAR
jgi:hypothetical protein